jgi:Type I phosphodiesterase / nucleotide pyrophosphatase
MIQKNKRLTIIFSAALLAAAAAFADDDGHINGRNGIQRVLLISVDGMHALDYLNCVSGGYCPNLAKLGKTGVNYTRTTTSRPSDSFPGLMALVTGGTPKTVGAFYDVAYDRVLAPPFNDTGNGNFSGACKPNQANGTTTEYEEGVELNQTLLNGGAPGASLTDGGVKAIDPTRLPRDPFKADPNNGGCAPVYPWNFIHANTIYGVIHAAGGYTAWSDKHAVYAAVSGPTGTANPSNVDDYYSPEINSNSIGLPGVTTADGLNCNVGGNPPDNNGDDWTTSFQNIRCYDQLKVNAILNEIAGKTHLGNAKAPVPNIFGMNFQAVSVGQKLIEKGVKGGYLDAAGTVSTNLKTEIQFVDAAIGQMMEQLQDHGLSESTLIIITAKHGQSPIDPNRFQEIGAGISTDPATVIASLLPPGSPGNPNTPAKTVTVTRPPLVAGQKLSPIGPTQDDISLLWLAPGASVTTAVADLEASGTAGIGLGQIFYGPSLLPIFNAPGLPPAGDSRTPDIIVQPNVGVIYTTSSKKQEEHGGWAQDDTNVMILVSNPDFRASTVTSFVETKQVAPTILTALGLDPNALTAVQAEGTPVLPGLPFNQ